MACHLTVKTNRERIFANKTKLQIVKSTYLVCEFKQQF